MTRFLWQIDTACHWLSRWRLLPRFAFRPLCDWCDRRLLASAPDDDEFAEFDTTNAEFDAMAAQGEPVEVVVPDGYRCDHMSVFIGGDARWTAVPEFGCRCKPTPVFRYSLSSGRE